MIEEINVKLTRLQNLISVMKLTENIFSKIEAYKVEDNIMILYWHAYGSNIQKLPYRMTSEQAANFAWGWLKQTESTQEKPDTDASIEKGWELRSKDCCLGTGETYAHITIRPIWFIYNK